jgi:hypothetical protein
LKWLCLKIIENVAALDPFDHFQFIIVPPNKNFNFWALSIFRESPPWMKALHSAMLTSATRAYQLWGRNTRRCAQAVARPNLEVIFDDSASDFNQPQV